MSSVRWREVARGIACASQGGPSSLVQNRETALSPHNANLRSMAGQLTRMGRSVSHSSVRGGRVNMLRWLPERYEAQAVRKARGRVHPLLGQGWLQVLPFYPCSWEELPQATRHPQRFPVGSKHIFFPEKRISLGRKVCKRRKKNEKT